MKTTKGTQKAAETDDLEPNYHFDYSKAMPNKYARMKKEPMIVLLEKDITRYFRTPEEVTNALRSLIHAIPERDRRTGLAR